MPVGRPFPPGVSGNPHGRPKKGQSLTELLEKYLDKKAAGDKVARKTMLAEELIRRAFGGWVESPDGKREYVRGSDTLLQYVYDRVDGKARQAIELSDEREIPPMVVETTPDDGKPA